MQKEGSAMDQDCRSAQPSGEAWARGIHRLSRLRIGRRPHGYGDGGGSIVAARVGTPCFISRMTAGLMALRSRSIEMRPVTPSKFFVAARAAAISAPDCD